ncbi:hypothetical protein OSB04_014919 [Centaurea solstitialis]|uniref:PGG domain-containing protein n=1 Tax=Centaurea solstitialis TaxID=347529 RepID=A0AA38SXZ9_9ASTR|nr:hypothetical protein OSB04_014919 [Centaurea solstitialis]
MAESCTKIEDLKYLYASIVNVSNFVSVKLSGKANYRVWRAQMLCLMESQQMYYDIVVDKEDEEFQSCNDTDEEIQREYLYDILLKGWIFGSLGEHVLSTVVDLDSASAVWRKLELIFDQENSIPQDPQEQYFTPTETAATVIENTNNVHLRQATEEGRWEEAKNILKTTNHAATDAISDGNTMLHLAVAKGQNDFVEKLLDYIDDGKDVEKRNLDGRTALHVAAMVGNKYAAELLVEKREELLGIQDNNGYVPLLCAYYNMQLNTFVYLLEATQAKKQPLPSALSSGSSVIGINHLITAIFTKQYDLASTLVTKYPDLATKDDQVLMAMARTFPREPTFGERLIQPFPTATFYLIYQLIRLLVLVLFYPSFVMYFLLWKALATVVPPIKHIEKKKKDYKEAKRILKLICDEIELKYSGTHNPCYRRPIIEATCHGVYEVVDEILVRSPEAIRFMNRNGHNIIQLAIINRSENIYGLIYHTVKRKDFYRTIMDSSKNNILHLAGRLAPSFRLSRTTGAALQLQRELQWFKEVEKLMLPTDLVKENIDMETPEMVFTREHEDLVKEGEKWMKATAESSSITVALIITIVFAAAITVPGGSNQETGIPLFSKEIAFTIFAVSDAFSLFASLAALLVFLSILSTRFAEQDFLVRLPRRLMIGLFLLFISTTAMLVAFCAILFLVFCDQRAWMVAPISGLVCMPIIVIATLQLPLVVELFGSTYISIFAKGSYIDNCKSNLNNMQSFFDRLRIEHES